MRIDEIRDKDMAVALAIANPDLAGKIAGHMSLTVKAEPNVTLAIANAVPNRLSEIAEAVSVEHAKFLAFSIPDKGEAIAKAVVKHTTKEFAVDIAAEVVRAGYPNHVQFIVRAVPEAFRLSEE